MNPEGGMFFIRFEFDLGHLDRQLPLLQHKFIPIADQFEMKWQLFRSKSQKKAGRICIQGGSLSA